MNYSVWTRISIDLLCDHQNFRNAAVKPIQCNQIVQYVSTRISNDSFSFNQNFQVMHSVLTRISIDFFCLTRISGRQWSNRFNATRYFFVSIISTVFTIFSSKLFCVDKSFKLLFCLVWWFQTSSAVVEIRHAKFYLIQFQTSVHTANHIKCNGPAN